MPGCTFVRLTATSMSSPRILALRGRSRGQNIQVSRPGMNHQGAPIFDAATTKSSQRTGNVGCVLALRQETR
jgi:hypothetical protein